MELLAKEELEASCERSWDPATKYVAPGAPPPTPNPFYAAAHDQQPREDLSLKLLLPSSVLPLRNLSAPPMPPPETEKSTEKTDVQIDMPGPVSITITTTFDAPPSPPLTPVKISTPHDAAFTIKDSETGGVGAFATRILRRGEVILEEAPLFVASRASVFDVFGTLSVKDKYKCLELHASDHFKPGTPRLEAVWDTNRYISRLRGQHRARCVGYNFWTILTFL